MNICLFAFDKEYIIDIIKWHVARSCVLAPFLHEIIPANLLDILHMLVIAHIHPSQITGKTKEKRMQSRRQEKIKIKEYQSN
jgi:hypothetical protein